MGAGKDAAVGALGGHQVAGIDEGRVGGVGGAQADGAGDAGGEEGGAGEEACGAGGAGGTRGGAGGVWGGRGGVFAFATCWPAGSRTTTRRSRWGGRSTGKGKAGDRFETRSLQTG